MDGPGAILAFEVVGCHRGARALLDALRTITHAVSLGSTDTLIQHPAGLTHRLVDAEAREAIGICEGLLRLSVGLEAVDDLWRDLSAGLEAAASAAVVAAPETVSVG
jgi:cystathionine beta-lyase/cystathionine gamma-synthase